MSLNRIRTLVSGKKARFIDSENAVDLDLVYVTDRIIIMGYPAVGISALYRNRRRDVLKFINSRHGDKWWIWNLCPLYENAYSPESMEHRVSRYPFPDHHPPPLVLLPLAVREIHAWLEGDPERVAIIHCKAGKGRSGTLLCSYMLSLPELPPPPQIDRNYTQKELDERLLARKTQSAEQLEQRPADGWVVVGAGNDVHGVEVSTTDLHEPEAHQTVYSVPRSTNTSTTTLSRPSPPPSIHPAVQSVLPMDVGDEGDPEKDGQRDRLNGKVDAVFKLHSSRRMKPSSTGRGVSIPSQRRWCRYVNLVLNNQAPPAYTNPHKQRIQLKSVTLVLHPPSGWQKPIASLVLGSGGTGHGKAWASVARYDDEYVAELRRRNGHGTTTEPEITWGGVGGEGVYDTKKMFRSCGKMVTRSDAATAETVHEDGQELHVHRLSPQTPDGAEAIILERDRELRLKLHLGSLPMGWLWMIPAFHLPETRGGSHTITFTRSQVDFAIGPGQALHKVVVEIDALDEGDQRETTHLMSDTEERETGYEDKAGETVKEDGE